VFGNAIRCTLGFGRRQPRERDYFSEWPSEPTIEIRRQNHSQSAAQTKNEEPKLFINLLPLWKGQKKQGVRYAPAILNSLAQEIANKKYSILTNYFSDSYINDTSNDKFIEHMASMTSKLERDMASYRSGDMVLNIGGDHAVAMISIQKMYQIYPNLRVIWIDAHADINSPSTSESGNFHGMPVHYLTELSGKDDKMTIDKISYIGVRDLDVAEIQILKDNNMKNYPKEEIVRRGSSCVIDELISEQDLLNNPVHISFDIDAVDPIQCPSTGTTAEGGLSIDDVVKMCKKIKATGNLVSIDLVEFNPLIGSDKDVEKTIQNIMKVFKEIL